MRIFLTNAIYLALPIMFSTLAIAAPSAPAAVAGTSGMRVSEHEGHGVAPNEQGKLAGMNDMRKPAWTAFPTLKTRVSGQGRENRVVTVVPQGMVADSIDVYYSDIRHAEAHRRLPLEMAGAKLGKPAVGGFLWLAAREQRAGEIRVASTVYFSSERGGKNPTAMFMQQKNELEIVPQPYPREHSRYRAGEDWNFIVSFNANPLANRKVLLETLNGSKAEYLSDAMGVISVHIPDDFDAAPAQKAAGNHDHGRRSSDFVLAVEYAENGNNYLTAFNSSYGASALDQRSLAMGLGFTLLGMMGAAPLLRQRKGKKQAADPTKTSAGHNPNNEGA